MDGEQNLLRELAEKLAPTPAEAEANARRVEGAMRENRAFLNEFAKKHTRPPGLTDAEEEERVYQNCLRAERELEVRERLGVNPSEAEHLVQHWSKELGYTEGASTEAAETVTTAAETTTATVGAETATVASAEVAGETVLAAGLEEGAATGLAVGTAGGFEIPVWGWIATGVAVAGGVGYGVYKHYQHKHEADTAAQKMGFKDATQALDAAKAGFKNSGELHFVDEAIKKAGMGDDLADYAHKHGHDSLEDFMKTANHGQQISGADYARAWGYQLSADPVEATGRVERRHFNKAQLLETQHIVAGMATVGEVEDVQRELKAEGLDIGKFGTKHDGVDGVAGRYTKKALVAALQRVEQPGQ